MEKKEEFQWLENRILAYKAKKNYNDFPVDVVMGLFFLKNKIFEDCAEIYLLFKNKGFYDLGKQENIDNMINVLIEEKLFNHIDNFIKKLPVDLTEQIDKESLLKKMEDNFKHPSLLHKYLNEMSYANLFERIDLDKIILNNGKNMEPDTIDLILDNSIYDFFLEKEIGVPYEHLSQENKEQLQKMEFEKFITYEKNKIEQSISSYKEKSVKNKKRL